MSSKQDEAAYDFETTRVDLSSTTNKESNENKGGDK